MFAFWIYHALRGPQGPNPSAVRNKIPVQELFNKKTFYSFFFKEERMVQALFFSILSIVYTFFHILMTE